MLFPVCLCLVASWLATVDGVSTYIGAITANTSEAHVFGYQITMWGTTRLAASAKYGVRRVLIYDLVGSEWTKSYLLQKPEWTTSQNKPLNLAFLSADCLLVKPFFSNPDEPKVYIYRLTAGDWSLEASFYPTSNEFMDVAADGSNILIGYSGSAFVDYYTYTQSDGFTHVQTISGPPATDSNFGSGVALHDNIAMISQWGLNAVHVYSLENGLFVEKSNFTVPEAAKGGFDNINGVGAVAGAFTGMFYTIRKTGTYTWEVMDTCGAPWDNSALSTLGWGLAFSGNTALVSACNYPTKKQGQVFQFNVTIPQPSAEPTLAPTRIPSVSSMPTYPHSHHPSVRPTAFPTFSLWPTLWPSEAPTRTPSTAPTVIPSVVPTNTKKPTMLPTRKPTRVQLSATPTVQPSALPTLASVAISFNSDIYLHNVSVSVLDTASQSAVVGAVADTLSLDNNQVSVVSQALVGTDGGRRVLTEATPHYEVKVVVKVDASTRDFEDATNQDGEYLFTKLTTILVDAVETQAFALTVREQSALLNASGTMYVGQVNVTASASYVVTNAVSNSDSNDDFSRGDFAGVVIGIVVSFLIVVGCVLAVWKYRGGAGGGGASAGKSEVQLV